MSRATVGACGGASPRENRLLCGLRAVEEFPALRESRDAVVAALDAGPDAQGAVLAAVVSDLGLAIRVVRAAVVVADSGRVASVAEAVGRLDPCALQAICQTAPTYDVLGPPGGWRDAPSRYLCRAVAVQRAVRSLTPTMARPDREALLSAALLYDVGRLALAHAAGRAGEPFVGPHPDQAATPSGVDHAAAGGLLLRRWGLPRAVWGPVERQGSTDAEAETDPGVAVLRLADLVARHGRGDDVAPSALLRAARTAKVGPDALRTALYDQAGIVTVAPGAAPCPLTRAELAALRGLSRGLRYKEIAQELGVQPTTIGTHLHKVYAKTGTTDRAQAVLLATARGWLDR